ncbi:MAG: hypothetical protein KGY69_17610 [Bacteroidales bacterium]|nr:hypothetical protein [Bacteroidales bacterium]
MKALRKITKVKDKRLVIDLPDDFNVNQVEVIIMPISDQDENDFWSEVSESSLDDIWNNTSDDEYEKLL